MDEEGRNLNPGLGSRRRVPDPEQESREGWKTAQVRPELQLAGGRPWMLAFDICISFCMVEECASRKRTYEYSVNLDECVGLKRSEYMMVMACWYHACSGDRN